MTAADLMVTALMHVKAEISLGMNMEMIRKIRLFSWMIIVMLIALHLPVLAEHNQYVFDQANKLYQQEQYHEAIARYLEILNSGYESWQLYYNLGNAYYKTRQIGRAILNYERAARLNPKNEDIQFNLQLANLSVVDKIITPPQFFLSRWIDEIKMLWSIQALTFIVIALYLLAAGLIVVRILVRRRSVQRFVSMWVIPVIVLLIVAAVLLVVRVNEHNSVRNAIIISSKIEVLSSPGDQATELFALHEGVKVRVEDVRQDWARIRLADGKVGWVKRDTFEII